MKNKLIVTGLSIFLSSVLFFICNKSIAADTNNQASSSAAMTATDTTPIIPVSPPKITKVFISDIADSEGYSSGNKSVIPRNAHHVYVTVEVDNAVANMTTLTVNLTGQNVKTESVTDLKKSGLVLKAFDFVRTKPWTPGEYLVNVDLLNGDNRAVKFTVKN